jgi:transposase
MKPPLFVRPLSPDEHHAIQAGLRSPSAFTLRRCQILLASARGQRPAAIARALGCAVQTVRDAIRAFHAEGTASLQRKSTRPHTTRRVLDPDDDERLRELLHRSPRDFGKPTGLWTLELVAEVYRQLDGDVEVVLLAEDGDRIAAGQTVAQVTGNLRAILTGERTALNLVCHLSGIATLTRRFVDAVAGTGARIRDTLRKLDRRHPELAAHLRETVSLGAHCSYRPAETIDWNL